MGCEVCICNRCKYKERCTDNGCVSCQYSGKEFATMDNSSDGCYGYVPIDNTQSK